MATSIDRRGFLKALAFGTAAIAGAGLAVYAEPLGDGGFQGLLTASGLPQAWHQECDVLVIGSGYAGLAAAYEARMAGADTLLIEKMPALGGNSAIADGDFAVCGSRAQAMRGIEDSVDLYVQDMLMAGMNLNDREKCRIIAEQSNAVWEWTQDELGVEWDQDEDGVFSLLPYGGHSVLRTMHPKAGSGSAIIQPLIDKLAELDVPMVTNRMLVKLFKDQSGRVIGVQANENTVGNDPNTGSPVFIKARKAVVLATGGFSSDVAWRTIQDPRLGDNVDCTNQAGATAESLGAAMKAGAMVLHLPWIQLGPWCSPDEKGYGKGPSYIDANVAYCPSIDPVSGKRIANELADRRKYAEAIIENGCPLIQIIDQRNIPAWNFEANLMPALKAGITWEIENLEEVARRFLIPLDALTETIHRYNGFVEAGVDDDFGKAIPADAQPIGAGPYFVTRVWPKVHHTMGGIKTDANAQVIDVSSLPIPGFFAAGEAVGGVHGASRLGSTATADCLINGLVAGRAAAAMAAVD